MVNDDGEGPQVGARCTLCHLIVNGIKVALQDSRIQVTEPKYTCNITWNNYISYSDVHPLAIFCLSGLIFY